MNPRPSLRPGLLSHRLDGQLMVYDKTDDNIHLLDGTTATVFELLEQGTGMGAIESKLDTQQTVAPGAELLALALDELAQARLLEGKERKSAPEMDNRRQALQKLAGVGAALLIPAIVTLVPRGAQAQASGVIGATVPTTSSVPAVVAALTVQERAPVTSAALSPLAAIARLE